METVVFSIVIPVFNEVKRINENIAEIFGFFSQAQQKIEIIFVNDGSTDATEELLKKYQNTYSFQIVSYPDNQGKGYAIRQGTKAAQGKWIVFFDIDLATPLIEFNYLVTFLKPKDQVVIGSRRLQDSEITKSESHIRVFLGQGFTLLSNLLVPGVTDFTCGFKCFSSAAAKVIFSKAQINRWGFDTELLYIAHLNGITIRQMAVSWRHDTDSRVKVFQAVFSSLKELWEMKLNYWKGLYT